MKKNTRKEKLDLLLSETSNDTSLREAAIKIRPILNSEWKSKISWREVFTAISESSEWKGMIPEIPQQLIKSEFIQESMLSRLREKTQSTKEKWPIEERNQHNLALIVDDILAGEFSLESNPALRCEYTIHPESEWKKSNSRTFSGWLNCAPESILLNCFRPDEFIDAAVKKGLINSQQGLNVLEEYSKFENEKERRNHFKDLASRYSREFWQERDRKNLESQKKEAQKKQTLDTLLEIFWVLLKISFFGFLFYLIATSETRESPITNKDLLILSCKDKGFSSSQCGNKYRDVPN